MLPCPVYYKQCCNEHWETCVSFNSGFLISPALISNLICPKLNPESFSQTASSPHFLACDRGDPSSIICAYCLKVDSDPFFFAPFPHPLSSCVPPPPGLPSLRLLFSPHPQLMQAPSLTHSAIPPEDMSAWGGLFGRMLSSCGFVCFNFNFIGE